MAKPKRAARPAGLLVVGIALIAVGITQNTSMAFIGAGVLFIIVGAVSMRKSRAAAADQDDTPTAG